MGNTVNPVAFRLGWTQSWVNDFYSKHLHYPQLLHTVLRLRFMVTHILRRILKGHRRRPYLFSHLNINKSVKKINVLIFFYDTISQTVWDKFYRRLIRSRRRPHTKLLVEIRNSGKRDIKRSFWKDYNNFIYGDAEEQDGDDSQKNESDNIENKSDIDEFDIYNDDINDSEIDSNDFDSEDEDDFDDDFDSEDEDDFDDDFEDDFDINFDDINNESDDINNESDDINNESDDINNESDDINNESDDINNESDDINNESNNSVNKKDKQYDFNDFSEEKIYKILKPKRRKNQWIRPLKLRVYFIFLYAYLKFACRNRTLSVFNPQDAKQWNRILFYSYKRNPLFLKEKFSDHQKNFLYHLLMIHKYFKYHKPTLGFAAEREFFWGAKYFLKNAFSFTWTNAFMRCFKVLLKRLSNHMIDIYNVDFHFFKVSISSTNAVFIAKFIAQKLYQGIRMWNVLNPIQKQLSWRMESNYMPMYKKTSKNYFNVKRKKFLNDLRINTLRVVNSYNSHNSLQLFNNKNLMNYESLKLSYDFYEKSESEQFSKKYFFVKPLLLLAFKLPLTSFIGFVNNTIKTNKKILKDNYYWVNSIFNDITNNYTFSYYNRYGSEEISNYYSNYNLNKIIQLSINAYLKYLDTKYMKFLMEWEYDYFKINKQHYRNLIKTTTKSNLLNLLGYKIQLKGRFSRKQKTSKYIFRKGVVSLNCISNNIDYGFTTIPLINSSVGIKIWLNWNRKAKPYIVKIL